MNRAQRLQTLIHDPNSFVVLPGVADALTAILAERAGFEALFLTGAGIANLHFGMPDLGLLSLQEVVDRVRPICRAVEAPVLVDADTGFGNALSVVRTVRALEEAGASGIMLEDQLSPKRCGHFEGKQVVELEEMLQKIRAFRYARRDPDLVLLARTDALAVHGLDEALRRIDAFAEAGADLAFVEAPTSLDQLRAIPKATRIPAVANMVEGGKTPLCSAEELRAMGFKGVIFANLSLRVAGAAVLEALQELRRTGTTAGLYDRMLSWTDRQELVGLSRLEALGDFLATGTPPTSEICEHL